MQALDGNLALIGKSSNEIERAPSVDRSWIALYELLWQPMAGRQPAGSLLDDGNDVGRLAFDR